MLLFSGVAVALLIAGGVFVYFAYARGWTWTGIPADPSPGSGQPARPEKTVWDWMQLFFVPLVIAITAFALAAGQSAHQRAQDTARATAERRRADDAAREQTLQSYLDRMSQLMLNPGLRARSDEATVLKLKAEANRPPVVPTDRVAHDGVVEEPSATSTPQPTPTPAPSKVETARTVARTLTLTTLSRLDAPRKLTVVRFLIDSGLLTARMSWSNPEVTYLVEVEWVTGSDGKLRTKKVTHERIGTGDPNGKPEKVDWSREPTGPVGPAKRDVPSVLSLDRADLRGLQFHELRPAILQYDRKSYRMIGSFTALDFSGADLRGSNFRGSRITANFGRTNLQGADFSNAALPGSTFAGSCLTDADFSNATLGLELSGALGASEVAPDAWTLRPSTNFRDTRGTRVDFTRADLRGADFSTTALTRVTLDGASLQAASFPQGWGRNGLSHPKARKSPSATDHSAYENSPFPGSSDGSC